ncbi:MAG TPA: tetratricopeptide repeat protein [Puia sp.]|nr:tetratricopeptide repeat protein [Puia sp.]
MKHSICVIALLTAFCSSSLAQHEDANSLDETAKAYTRQGDYSNAVVVLSRALRLDPHHLASLKDLAFTYYLQKNYSMALETAKPLPDRPDADVECYQILGIIYKELDERKECEKMYKQGIKRFPSSGVLYNEYGEMLWTKQDYSAIHLWEKGIETDPNYASNYYNAAKYYFFTYDKVWSLVYGEMFINMESYSKRTPEIKNILVEGYKKLFSDTKKSQKNKDIKDPFALAFLSVMNDQWQSVALGVTTESVTLLRTRFSQEWFEKYAGRFPFRLFEYHRQLIREGMFDAYNQWIFGAAQDQPAFQRWTAAHTDEYNRFINFQQGRIYKVPPGQYYHDSALK